MRKVYVSKSVIGNSVRDEQNYWDNNWSSENAEISLERIKKEEYFEKLLNLFKAYKPKRILEAGCGRGQWIKGFQELGNTIDGTDFSFSGLQVAKKHNKTLLFQSDLRFIPVKTGTYDFILSLGVIEHFEEGPEDTLKEHARILRSGGIMFAHVPYLNLNRRLNLLWRIYEFLRQNSIVRRLLGLPQPIFFEYMMTKKEVLKLFKNCGFEIIESQPIYVGGGFDYDIPAFLKIGIFGQLIGIFKSFINLHQKCFGPIFGHHYLIICKKI